MQLIIHFHYQNNILVSILINNQTNLLSFCQKYQKKKRKHWKMTHKKCKKKTKQKKSNLPKHHQTKLEQLEIEKLQNNKCKEGYTIFLFLQNIPKMTQLKVKKTLLFLLFFHHFPPFSKNEKHENTNYNKY